MQENIACTYTHSHMNACSMFVCIINAFGIYKVFESYFLTVFSCVYFVLSFVVYNDGYLLRIKIKGEGQRVKH